MSIEERFFEMLRDNRVESVHIHRLDKPGRGEDPAVRVQINPKPDIGKPCHAILRTPQAAIRQAMDEWDRRIGKGETRSAEDLLA